MPDNGCYVETCAGQAGEHGSKSACGRRASGQHPSRARLPERASASKVDPSGQSASLHAVKSLPSVRADRSLSRSGLFAIGPRQTRVADRGSWALRGDRGLRLASASPRTTTSWPGLAWPGLAWPGLAWLCERWAARSTPSGVTAPHPLRAGLGPLRRPALGQGLSNLAPVDLAPGRNHPRDHRHRRSHRRAG